MTPAPRGVVRVLAGGASVARTSLAVRDAVAAAVSAASPPSVRHLTDPLGARLPGASPAAVLASVDGILAQSLARLESARGSSTAGLATGARRHGAARTGTSDQAPRLVPPGLSSGTVPSAADRGPTTDRSTRPAPSPGVAPGPPVPQPHEASPATALDDARPRPTALGELLDRWQLPPSPEPEPLGSRTGAPAPHLAAAARSDPPPASAGDRASTASAQTWSPAASPAGWSPNRPDERQAEPATDGSSPVLDPVTARRRDAVAAVPSATDVAMPDTAPGAVAPPGVGGPTGPGLPTVHQHRVGRTAGTTARPPAPAGLVAADDIEAALGELLGREAVRHGLEVGLT